MRHFLMYMDESGVANLAKDSQYFVLSGLVVEDKVDNDLSAYLRFIKRRHELSEEVSLHAYDLFENRTSNSYLPDTNSKSFTASISEFVENAPFKVLVFYVDKNELCRKIQAPEGYSFKGSKRHKQDKELAYEMLARKLFFEFAKILRKEKAIGSVIAESRRSSDDVLLRAYLDAQDPQTFVSYPTIQKQAEMSKEYIHSICFASKKSLKGALELVDIISYCTYGELTGMFPPRRNDRRGVKVMWMRIKTQIGESKIQKISTRAMSGLIPDRIDETTKRIQARLNEFRDLVNPTG